jgi:hypothetical protein
MYLKNYFIQAGKNIFLRFPKRIFFFLIYLQQFIRFRKAASQNHRMPVRIRDAHPCLKDKIKTTPVDQHYIYHPAWAARILAQTRPAVHVDISSILHFGTIVSSFIPVKFYDYRPVSISLSDYESGYADLKNLPFANDSVASLSCMHTVEHVGLGRYGDELDSEGDLKAMEELKRVLKPGGDLLLVVPVGKPRVEFNAHRVYSFEQVRACFPGFQLKEFSLIPDQGNLLLHAEPSLASRQEYGCGCFWFKK